MNEPLPILLRRVAAVARAGRGVVACLIVAARGSTPQPAGAVMFLDDTGHLFGTIGGGCLEAEVRRRAMALISEQRSALLRFKLDHDYGWDDGLICGGTVELAIAPAPPADQLDEIAATIERGHPSRISLEVQTDTGRERMTLDIPPRARLYIAGAGHIGCAVARHALALDFDVTIFDDRPDLLAGAPRSARTVCGPIAERLAEAAIDASTFCLIVTRGHRHDQQALQTILERINHQTIRPRYIGMIGSRRKVKVIFDCMESNGTPHAQLAAVHAPVGLPIGAQTVEEIAISIAAQLVQIRAAGGAHHSIERCPLSSAVASDLPSPPLPPIGLLLAAGKGRRMGCTKQLLPLPDDPQKRTLAAAAFDAIACACGHMIVVVGHDAEAVLASLGGGYDRPFTPIYAPAGTEMSESLRAGLRAAADLDPTAPILLHLADHPRVDPRTRARILDAWRANPTRAILPNCAGRGGHPILIPATLIPAILEHPLDGGLRAWWESHPETCIHIPIDDPSILLDLDTPDQYRAMTPDRPATEPRHGERLSNGDGGERFSSGVAAPG